MTYDPEDAVPYLTMLAERLSQINDGKAKLKGKIVDKAKKKKKEKITSGSFGKYC